MCCCPSEAGNVVCDLKVEQIEGSEHQNINCPECRQNGKPVEGQTVKAVLSITLREMKAGDYRFCGTETCPVVYFSVLGHQVFTISEVRERVYQKEPQAEDVLVCYCFNHTLSEIRNASPGEQEIILADINTGIKSGQCACDLRNPQGSCCLGNLRKLMREND
jgi:hypothetical protein